MENNKNNFFSNKYYKVIEWIAIVIFMLLYSRYKNITIFPYDSNYYFRIADGVFNSGFNLLNFPETYRGYFLVSLISLGKVVLSNLGIYTVWAWRILVAIITATLFVYVLPIIFSIKINNKKTLVGTIFAILLLIYFWGDFLQYPLSDYPSTFFILLAAALIIEIINKEFNIKSILKSLMAGMMMYAAYNTRVVFLYGCILLIIIYIVVIIIQKNYKKFINIIMIIIGIFIIAIPQMIINNNYVNKYSPKVFTESRFGYKADLQSQQLLWGIKYYRYETFDGDASQYPDPRMFFCDPKGEDLLVKSSYNFDSLDSSDNYEFGMKEYFELFAKHPLRMIGIYFRHLINAATPVFNKLYIKNINSNKIFFISLGIVLWLATTISLIFNNQKKITIPFVILCSCLLPSAMQIAGAVEIRYFIIFYLVLYFYLCCVVNYNDLIKATKGKRIFIILACVIVFFIWINCISSYLKTAAEKPIYICNSFSKK